MQESIEQNQTCASSKHVQNINHANFEAFKATRIPYIAELKLPDFQRRLHFYRWLLDFSRNNIAVFDNFFIARRPVPSE